MQIFIAIIVITIITWQTFLNRNDEAEGCEGFFSLLVLNDDSLRVIKN